MSGLELDILSPGTGDETACICEIILPLSGSLSLLDLSDEAIFATQRAMDYPRTNRSRSGIDSSKNLRLLYAADASSDNDLFLLSLTCTALKFSNHW